MDVDRAKDVVLFGGALLIAALLVWLGFKFLFLPHDVLNPVLMFVFGICLTVGGIVAVSTPSLGKNWLVGGLLIAAGFYVFGRAAGTIAVPWLPPLLGILCWVAAGLVIYITLPRKKMPT